MITPVSIFYVNDYHGKPTNIERTVTASRAFDRLHPKNKLKLSAGDFMLGEMLPVNRMAVAGQNLLGIMASAVGNHEYDMPKDIDKIIPDMKYRLLACNISIKPENPLSKKVERSYIQEVDGKRYGIVGTSPVDLLLRIKQGEIVKDLQISDVDKTIREVQQEVDRLRAQGISKIILLSHTGLEIDQRIARETDGIDVIIGGHSHELIEGIKEGVNLFYSKSGEPVVITQAGRDGRHFGVLNAWFNDKGVIAKVRNNVERTGNFKRDAITRRVFDQILGKPQQIAQINSAPPPVKNDLCDPNTHANFIADAMKNVLNADIALFASCSIRGHFNPGNIDSRLLEEISPFNNNLCLLDYSEKEIIDMLKYASTSLVSAGNKPGIMHTSGLRYTISKDGKLLSAGFVGKDGREIPIDINNPRTDKFYKVAITDFHAAGNDGYAANVRDVPHNTGLTLNQCIENYLKGKSVDIAPDDGRVKIV